jgi:hypothetical protein
MSQEPDYKTPDEMQVKIDDYFKTIKRWTIPGLCLHLGFNSRNTLSQYDRRKPEFESTIARARLMIESQRNEALVDPEARNVNGMKFDLQNNFGWRDGQDLNIGGQSDNPFNIKVIFDDKKE